MVIIGVIGANGQVGSEVCLFLSRMNNVKVIPICRTELGSAFLRICGLECRHGILESPEEGTRLLADCDLVADFSRPTGLQSEQRTIIGRNITNAIRCAPSHARFVYASSMMAFGMGYQSQVNRRYILAHTSYGKIKRYAERLAFREGRQIGREIYVLYLGQVHGELQAVSRGMMQELRNQTAYIPDGPSYTVFTFSVAEALLNIALGKERPGSYTLVSVPEWSWKEVYEFYAQRKGIKPQIVLLNEAQGDRKTWPWRAFFLIKQFAFHSANTFAIRQRELMVGYLLSLFPGIEKRARAMFSCRNASAQISEGRRQLQYRPYELWLLGRVPGKRLETLSDSRKNMGSLANEVRELLRSVDARVSGNYERLTAEKQR